MTTEASSTIMSWATAMTASAQNRRGSGSTIGRSRAEVSVRVIGTSWYAQHPVLTRRSSPRFVAGGVASGYSRNRGSGYKTLYGTMVPDVKTRVGTRLTEEIEECEWAKGERAVVRSAPRRRRSRRHRRSSHRRRSARCVSTRCRTAFGSSQQPKRCSPLRVCRHRSMPWRNKPVWEWAPCTATSRPKRRSSKRSC